MDTNHSNGDSYNTSNQSCNVCSISNGDGEIVFSKGCVMYKNGNLREMAERFLQFVPEHCQMNQQKRDGAEYHITVVSKSELKAIVRPNLTEYFQGEAKFSKFNVIDFGVGVLKSPNRGESNSKTYFLLAHAPELDQMRKDLNLESIDFHVTLGFDTRDIHNDGNKSLKTIQQINKDLPIQCLLAHPSPYKAKQIGYLEWAVSEYPTNPSIRDTIKELIKLYPKSKYNKIKELIDLLIGLGDLDGFYVQAKIEQALAMPRAEIFKNISPLFNLEFDVVNPKSVHFLLDFFNSQISSETIKKQLFYVFENGKFIGHALPFNFSWVQPNVLGGSSIPSASDLKLFSKMGIVNVITCLEEPLNVVQDDVKIHFFRIDDRTPPTMNQLEEMLDIVQRGGPTIVHCKGGVGRTNTVLACALIKQQKLSSDEAIAQIKSTRPKVILDERQIKFVKQFSNLQYSCHKPKIKLPKLMVFAGYPASGKSTLSTHIVKYFGDTQIVRINQDECGRKATTEQFNQNLKNSKTIIVDNCNLTKEKRKVWIDLAFNTNQAWCVYFNYTMEELKYRIVRRINHPTVKNGLKILSTLKDQLEEPTSNEGFSQIIRIENDEDLSVFLNDLGITDPIELPPESKSQIVKFCRTRHLANLGGATRDDLLLTSGEQTAFLQFELDVEEKIDGANLGITVKSDYKISVQNRSHYVSSSYHAQFSLLDSWILKHTDELINLLEPEVEILYGEWCYMKHSIHYTNLPDYFVAFDIFNCLTQTFLSRRELQVRLEGTSISQVPLILRKKFSNVKELTDIASKTKSKFYDGIIEGVYLRVCDEKKTIDRAKIVRKDFICGDSQAKGSSNNVRHWTKAQLTKNILDFDGS